MWLLLGLLAFVLLQGFSPDDTALFHSLVTSLSKCLAHQASVLCHTLCSLALNAVSFITHLPAYFSEVNKRAMLSSPLVCSDALFAESDIARLLADTQTSSSLVDVASHGSGARRRHYSPHRSSTRSSPSRHRRRDSGSPSRQSKCVHFDSPAPSSALKGSLADFCKVGSCPSSDRVGGCLAAHWEVWESWGADPWVVQVLRYGYWVLFCSRPPLSCVPLPLPRYTPTSIQGLALAAAVVDLQEKEAIEPAAPSPGYYSHLL